MDSDALFAKFIDDKVPASARVLKKEILDFISMIEQIMREMPDTFGNTELEDIVLIQDFFSHIGPIELMTLIVKQVLPHSKQIKQRDKNYFAHHAMDMFGDFEHSKVTFFYDILVNDKLDEEDMNAIWDFFNVFVDLAEKYKKTK